jgi:hypothetical protein
VKCDKSYDELKDFWQSLKQDFNHTHNSVIILHEIVNEDEINREFDRCDCHLIKLERAYKQALIADINNLSQLDEAINAEENDGTYTY